VSAAAEQVNPPRDGKPHDRLTFQMEPTHLTVSAIMSLRRATHLNR